MEPVKQGEKQAPSSCHLYRHFDKDGKLLYVGVSLSAVARLAQHRDSSAWFEKIETVKIERFESREAAIHAERNAILLEHPVHNISRPGRRLYEINAKTLQVERSRKDLLQRTTQFDPTYQIKEIANMFDTSPARVHDWMNAGKLGYIEIPWRVGCKPRALITGWQLISFIEYMENQSKKASK